MYKWPSEINPSSLSGLIVELISFSQNTITLVLSGAFIITVESRLILALRGIEDEIEIPAGNTKLLHLLGKKIEVSTLAIDGSSLLFEFEDGYQLTIDGNDTEYECFHINANGKEFTV